MLLVLVKLRSLFFVLGNISLFNFGHCCFVLIHEIFVNIGYDSIICKAFDFSSSNMD